MKAKRFSEEQIIAVLNEAEAGPKTKDLCRRHGISDATGAAESLRATPSGRSLDRRKFVRALVRHPTCGSGCRANPSHSAT